MSQLDFRDRIPPESAAAFAVAAVCVGIAGLLRWTVGLLVPDVVPFTFFFAAILIATLVGGKGPGLFAALLGGVVSWWAFVAPPMAFLPLSAGQAVSLATYFIASFVIVWAAHRYQLVVRRLEREENLRQLAVEELAHRLKNKVATIQAIVSLRLREDTQARDDILNCLNALKATDDLIIATQGRGAQIGDILHAELRPYDPSRVLIAGPRVILTPKLAMTMALLFHELATNAAKYGALSVPQGKIAVGWTLSDPQLRLEWRENGGPVASGPARSGFGTKLVTRALQQFSGNAKIEFESTGLVCTMEVPLSELDISIVPSSDDTTGTLAPATNA